MGFIEQLEGVGICEDRPSLFKPNAMLPEILNVFSFIPLKFWGLALLNFVVYCTYIISSTEIRNCRFKYEKFAFLIAAPRPTQRRVPHPDADVLHLVATRQH